MGIWRSLQHIQLISPGIVWMGVAIGVTLPANANVNKITDYKETIPEHTQQISLKQKEFTENELLNLRLSSISGITSGKNSEIRSWNVNANIGDRILWNALQSQSVAQRVDSTDEQSQFQSVSLTLPDVVTLLLQNNQELKNAALERIVQRQELRQAESAFSPQFQPLLGIGMSQTLSDGGFAGGAPLNSSSVGGFGGSMSGGSDRLSNGTVITRGAQVAGQLRTPLGTSLSVTVNPFESQRIGVTVTQPLLRGVGARVNQAPVNQARLTEEQNQWALQQRISEQITEAGVAYRALARAQEALRIEQASLEQQQQELNFVQVLVDAGRRARSELVQVRANIATTETRVLTAQNALEQAKSNLLNLLDLEESLAIAIPPELIAEFQTGEIPAAQYAAMQVEQLLPAAYENRPEYQQALLAIEVAKQGQIIAQDNQRWGLDVQARMGVGDTSDVAAGVTLTRRFGDESLNTEQQRSEVTLQQRQNDLTRITEEIRLEVGDRLRDVNSALARITAAQQATQLAEQRLEIATERFRRGRDGDLFQVLSLQNDIVLARNEEVNAKIDFLDAVSRLDQARGLTLGSWRSQIEASGLLRE